MTTLTNQFIAIGILSECRIDLYLSRLKLKFSLDIGGNVITMSYHIDKRFNKGEFDNMIMTIPQINPLVNGYIYLNGIEKNYTLTKGKTMILATGNIYPSADGKTFWFNAASFRIVPLSTESKMDITIAGAFVGQNQILNVVADSPRLFNVEIPNQNIGEIVKMKLFYNSGYVVNDNIIHNRANNKMLILLDSKRTNNYIAKDRIDNWLLEWEIVNAKT